MEDIKILHDIINSKVKNLTDRQKFIINSRYWLGDANDVYTYEKLGEILNIPCEKVDKIEQITIYQLIKRIFPIRNQFYSVFGNNPDVVEDMCRISYEMKRKNADINKIITTEYLGFIFLLSKIFIPNIKGAIRQKRLNERFKRECSDFTTD